MKVIFFTVDNVLNFPGSEAKAPDGSPGVADQSVKDLKKYMDLNSAKLVLIGRWAKEWNFDEGKCTLNGVYLNKKLNRKGLHLLDKTEDIPDWLSRHQNVTEYCILKGGEEVVWTRT